MCMSYVNELAFRASAAMLCVYICSVYVYTCVCLCVCTQVCVCVMTVCACDACMHVGTY